jgi:hypothetical protein
MTRSPWSPHRPHILRTHLPAPAHAGGQHRTPHRSRGSGKGRQVTARRGKRRGAQPLRGPQHAKLTARIILLDVTMRCHPGPAKARNDPQFLRVHEPTAHAFQHRKKSAGQHSHNPRWKNSPQRGRPSWCQTPNADPAHGQVCISAWTSHDHLRRLQHRVEHHVGSRRSPVLGDFLGLIMAQPTDAGAHDHRRGRDLVDPARVVPGA